MKTTFAILLLIVMSSSFSPLGGQSVVINELQNRNCTTLADEDGDYEDWAEIKNTGASSVNLSGYGITDDEAEPFQWILPDLELAPGEIILVWLSGKDRTDAASELHTNFSLSDSEVLQLVSPGQVDVDLVPAVYLPKDISYGRNASSEPAYFGDPTPGAPNLSQSFSGICQPPVLSQGSGFYEEAFMLSISADDDVIYTTDGSDPLPANVDAPQTYQYKNKYAFNTVQSPGPFLTETVSSTAYDGPISIEDRSGEPDRISQKASSNDFAPSYFPDSPSFKGTVIRARAMAPDMLPSEIVSRVFFITPQGWDRYNLPVVSLVLSDLELFDYTRGFHTAGQTFDVWREANPEVFPPPIFKANYGRRGTLWERPVWMEFFDMEGQSVTVSNELGARIHGASSRKFPRKSFRLYARNSYNTGELEYPFFGNEYPAVFERVLLRNAGGDEQITNMRDAVIHRMADPIRAITSPSRPHYLFLNGEFYGLNVMREYFDDNYFKIRFDTDGDDLDLIKGEDEIDSGDDVRYLAIADLCATQDFAEAAAMDQFYEWVDADSYIDVFAVNMIASNADMFPKNTIWWRDKSPTGADDRFRSVLIDLDKSWASPLAEELASPGYDMVTHYLADTDEDMVPYLQCFVAAMENTPFRERFINRSADMLNTYFSTERTTALIEEMRDLYLPRYGEHIDRWSGNSNIQSVPDWLLNIDTMLAFADARPDFHRQHISSYFGTDGTYDLVLDVSEGNPGHVHINTIDITADTEGIPEEVYPWEGAYFKNVGVTLTAVAQEGFVFSHWEGALDDEAVTVTSSFEADSIYVKAVFVADSSLAVRGKPAPEVIAVFPNPSRGTYRIEPTKKEIGSYAVCDLAGRTVLQTGTFTAPDRNFTIAGSSPGVYLLEVTFKDASVGRAKLVKQ